MPPKKKKSTNDGGSTVKQKKAKSPNFTTDEDGALAKAFANVTANPITGVEQKAGEFWGHVADKYAKVLQATVGDERVKSFPERDEDSLKNRFTRHSQPEMQLGEDLKVEMANLYGNEKNNNNKKK